MPRIVEDDTADKRRRPGRPTAGRGRESAVTNVPIRDLAPGDRIRGRGNLEETTCTVEAVGSFGSGPVYGNYTNDHFVLDRGSNNVKAHGQCGPWTHKEKFGLLTDCPLGLDESETGFAPIDGDFCGAARSELSWTDYLALLASILRVVRASGGYLFAGGSYVDVATARGGSRRRLRGAGGCVKGVRGRRTDGGGAEEDRGGVLEPRAAPGARVGVRGSLAGGEHETVVDCDRNNNCRHPQGE